MNKYDMMIACNRKTSEEKISRAVTEIRQMLAEEEKVTVPKLVKRTGLSRGFFYKNEAVRKEMDRAVAVEIKRTLEKRCHENYRKGNDIR